MTTNANAVESGRSRIPAPVGLTAGIATLGGFLFGYDTGVISAALLYIRPEFGLSTVGVQLVVASLLLGAITGVLAGGPITDAVGRKRVLIWLAALFIVSSLACAVVPEEVTLSIARFALGLCVGASSLVVPAYIAEIAPPEVRGRLVGLQIFMITAGILVAYLVGYAFAESGNWRLMLGLGAVPALLMMIGLFRLDESPRWLMIHGHTDEARTILAANRTAAEVEREIEEISEVLETERRMSYRDLLRPRLRPAVVLSVAVAAINQAVGVNAVIYYAPTMLQDIGFGDSAAILSSVGIGTANLVAAAVALVLVDRIGRRPLFLGGLAGVVVSLIALGALYFQPKTAAVAGLLVTALMVYQASFAMSVGLAMWIVNSEVFPTTVRGKASAFGTVTHWGLDFLVSLTALSLFIALTPSGTFWLFAVVGLLGWTYLYKHLPETKDRTLEEVQAIMRRRAKSSC